VTQTFHLNNIEVKFEVKVRSKFKVTGGKQELRNCWDGLERLKSRHELETTGIKWCEPERQVWS